MEAIMAIALTIAKGVLDGLTAVGRTLLGLLVISVHWFGLALVAVTKSIGLSLNFSFASTATIFREGVGTVGQCLSLAFLALIVLILYVTLT
jgi:hypothetical protein